MEETLVSKDKEIRGAVVRVKAGKGASSFLRRPIQRLYPLKVQHESPLQIVLLKSLSRVIVNRKLLQRREITQMRRLYLLLMLQKTPSIKTPLISWRIHCLLSQIDSKSPETSVSLHPRRHAATEARDRIVARLLDS